MSPPSPEQPVRGSCLCGGVRFEVTLPFRRASFCHCSRCRKHSGADGLAQGRVALDEDPGIRPQLRTFVESETPWLPVPEDDLPRYPAQKPRVDRPAT